MNCSIRMCLTLMRATLRVLDSTLTVISRDPVSWSLYRRNGSTWILMDEQSNVLAPTNKNDILIQNVNE